MTWAHLNLPDETVIAIYEAPGPQKNVAKDFAVGIAAVSQIKSMKRHKALIQKYLADQVRAEFAPLVTMAFCPRSLFAWRVE